MIQCFASDLSNMDQLLGQIGDALAKAGIEFDRGCCSPVDGSESSTADCGCEFPQGVKVVCVTPGLQDSVASLGEQTRDHVVMVRVDERTKTHLDDWVESGAVRSRSEAAALFIREGLRVRESELERLRDAISEVEAAKRRLRDRARDVFGNTENE